MTQELDTLSEVSRITNARGMTKRQIEVLVAEWAPKPDVPARMRKLSDARGVATTAQSSSASQVCGTGPTSMVAVHDVSAPPSASVPSSVVEQSLALQLAPAVPVIQATLSQPFALQPVQARASSTPLSPGRFSLALTLGQDDHDKLEQLRDLLRHQNPSGDLASIVARALRELHEREMKRRFAQVKLPKRVARGHARPGPDVNAQSAGLKRNAHGKDDAQPKANAQGKDDTQPNPNAQGKGGAQSKPNAHAKEDEQSKPNAQGKHTAQFKLDASKSRYNPRKVVREVYVRDDGRCTFVSPDGRRCAARGFLEVHHHGTTYARGGEATVDNLRIACRAHNLWLADRDYGRGFMEDRLREAMQKKRARSSVQERVHSCLPGAPSDRVRSVT